MPELPEVETIARRLQQVLPGKKIINVSALHPKSWLGDNTQVVGQEIVTVSRRAKILLVALRNGLTILCHLKMTGQLIYVDESRRLGGGHPTADWVQTLPSKHTRVVIELARAQDGQETATVFFNDQRLFGWLKVVNATQLDEIIAQLGPDVNDPSLNSGYLGAQLKRRSIPIKQAMMDNTIICGLGNIYICDALNLAQLHPERPANTLKSEEINRLLKASQQVIQQGIELGGTTFDGKYVDTAGFAGKYQTKVRVYGRAGQTCLNCGGVIVKTKLGGRGTYFCPGCQV